MSRRLPCDRTCESWILSAVELVQLHPFRRMEVFSRSAGSFGFFLDLDRFAQSFHAPEPLGHPSRPSRALLSAVCLCSVALSGDEALTPHEPILLSRALYYATQVSFCAHPSSVKHALQAEILIANYFFLRGLVPEGKSHIDAAMLIVTVHRAHKIHQISGADGTKVLDQMEWANGFWSAYFFDKSWSIAGGLHSTSPDGLAEEARIDTPWPLELQKFKNVGIYFNDLVFPLSALMPSRVDPTWAGSARARYNQSVSRKPHLFVRSRGYF